MINDDKNNSSSQTPFSVNEAGTQNIQSNIATKESLDLLDKTLRDEILKTRDGVTTNFITSLGIFASIVTFLLIEIQILKNICDFWRLIGFSAFILGGLITFAFILYLLFSNLSKLKIISILTSVIILLVFSLITLFKATDEYTCKLTNLNESFEKLSNEIRQSNNIQYSELKNRLDIMDNIIKKLNEK